MSAERRPSGCSLFPLPFFAIRVQRDGSLQCKHMPRTPGNHYRGVFCDEDPRASDIVVTAGQETCMTRDLIIERLRGFTQSHMNAEIVDDAEILRRFFGRVSRNGVLGHLE